MNAVIYSPMQPYTAATLMEQVALALDAGELARASRVKQALLGALLQHDWLPPDRRTANHQNYARHLLHADPAGRFSVLSIVWSPGQKSPVHGHHTWCAVGVFKGEIEESFFDKANGQAAPVQRHNAMRGVGSVTYADAGAGIHRIANRADEVAVTIHVYGVGADRVTSGINRVYA